MWNLKNKIKEQTKEIRLRCREQTDGFQIGRWLWVWVKKSEEIKKYKLVVTK